MTREISFHSNLNRFRLLVGSDRGFAQIQLDQVPRSGLGRFLFSLPVNFFAFLPDSPSSGENFLQFLNSEVVPMPSAKVPLLQNSVDRGADVERRSWRFLDSSDVTEIEL